MATFLGLSEEEIQLFLDETGEHLDTLETELLAIEDQGVEADRIARLFRAAHTIKGATATVGLEGMASLTHHMETLFDKVRSGVLVPKPAVVTLLLQAVDYLRDSLVSVEADTPPAVVPQGLLDAIAAACEARDDANSAGDAAYVGDAPADAAGASVATDNTADSAGNASGAGAGNAAVGKTAADETAAASESVTVDQANVENSVCKDANAVYPEELVVRVAFAADCQLPAVRALQVLLALRTLGNVLTTDPAESDIRSGKVGGALTLKLAPGFAPQAIHTALSRIGDLVQIALETTAGVPVVCPVPQKPEAKNPAAHEATKSAAAAGADSKSATAPATGAGQSKEPAKNERGMEKTSSGKLARNGAAEESHQMGDRTIRVDVGLLDDLMNLVGELVIDRGRLGGIGQALGHGGDQQNLADELGQVSAHLARVTGSLQETVLKARMLPVKLVFKKFPRMVRDLAQQMGKQVDFRIIGEETELDRSLLEVIGDPLMHLIRNALDHGIESKEERRRVGKPDVAVLQLSAGYEENQVVILVQDDGHGIDPATVRAAAVRKGVLTAERAKELDEQDAIQLLFAPGFSTAEKVTDISGRGVGLDVVRKNIERVGGRIEVESQVGQGCTFRMLLPLTLATIQSLLVNVGTDTLALPLSTTAEVMHVDPADLSMVGGCWMTRVRGRVVPLIWLEQFMTIGFQPKITEQPLLAVLVNYKGEPVGLVVDRLIGEQEVVVKGLGEFFGQMKGISGVTILGDGSLALIMDTAGLVNLLMAEVSRNSSGNGEAASKLEGGSDGTNSSS